MIKYKHKILRIKYINKITNNLVSIIIIKVIRIINITLMIFKKVVIYQDKI